MNVLAQAISKSFPETTTENERYILKYLEGKQLTAGITLLNEKQETRGHSHKHTEEVYLFLSGEGCLIIDEEQFNVKPGDLKIIPRGAFHKVINYSNEKLAFFVTFVQERV